LKKLFKIKLFIPLVIAFLCWGILSSIAILTLKEENLQPHTGLVESVQLKKESNPALYRSYKHNQLIFKLSNGEFRLRDQFDKFYFPIRKAIKTGDEITVYTLQGWRATLVFGLRNDIYLIKKNDETVFSIDSVKDRSTKELIFFVIGTVVLLAISIYRRKRNIA